MTWYHHEVFPSLFLGCAVGRHGWPKFYTTFIMVQPHQYPCFWLFSVIVLICFLNDVYKKGDLKYSVNKDIWTKNFN